jgi:hypothetical protein
VEDAAAVRLEGVAIFDRQIVEDDGVPTEDLEDAVLLALRNAIRPLC